VSLVADVSAVMASGEAEVWSEVICARLAELRPALYANLDPTGLATLLGAYGIQTKQVWGKTADGKKANHRGVARAGVLAVISSGSPLDPSGPASGNGDPPASGNTPPAGSSALAVAAVPSWHFASPGAIAAASANGGILSPAGWLAAAGIGLAALAVYLICAAIWPYGPCLGCVGHPGKKARSSSRRWGRCKRCKDSGERIRWGYKVVQALKGGSR
jgi:hypothetical protein